MVLMLYVRASLYSGFVTETMTAAITATRKIVVSYIAIIILTVGKPS